MDIFREVVRVEYIIFAKTDCSRIQFSLLIYKGEKNKHPMTTGQKHE